MPTRAEQRRLVWSGKMRKTTGGLSRDDLVLNRHGRIVSKRKSQAASKVNNLGNWLRNKGQKFGDVPQQAKKGSNGKPKKEAAKAAKVKKIVPKKIAKAKPKPKVVPKPKPKPKPKPLKKKKLDSKKTVVKLHQKATKLAAKNSRAKPEKSVPKVEKAYKPHKIDLSAAALMKDYDYDDDDDSW